MCNFSSLNATEAFESSQVMLTSCKHSLESGLRADGSSDTCYF